MGSQLNLLQPAHNQKPIAAEHHELSQVWTIKQASGPKVQAWASMDRHGTHSGKLQRSKAPGFSFQERCLLAGRGVTPGALAPNHMSLQSHGCEQ